MGLKVRMSLFLWFSVTLNTLQLILELKGIVQNILQHSDLYNRYRIGSSCPMFGYLVHPCLDVWLFHVDQIIQNGCEVKVHWIRVCACHFSCKYVNCIKCTKYELRKSNRKVIVWKGMRDIGRYYNSTSETKVFQCCGKQWWLMTVSGTGTRTLHCS